MRAILAQVIAEARIRLRSTSTIFAVLGVFALSFLYLPDPSANRVSISWRDEAGTLLSGVYSSSYVGGVVGMLSSLFLTLIGFYLVAGSIRRDRERHVLEIIAATPLSRLEFITGKWLAHSAYLLIVAATSILAGIILFLRYGEGDFEPLQFLLPWMATVPGAMLFTAALAVLFDVTPILRSRVGWVVWFFAWTFLFMFIPSQLAGRMGSEQTPRPTIYDPAGLMAFEEIIETTVPSGTIDDLSMGIMVIDEPVIRVPLGQVTMAMAAQPRRAWNAVWIAIVVLISASIFRFKPAAPKVREKRSRVKPEVESGRDGSDRVSWLPSTRRETSTLDAVLTESILIWRGAGMVRWLYLVTVILAPFLPWSSVRGIGAIALLLLGPILSEVSAREFIHGTTPIIFTSPSVPRSQTWWKLAACLLFVGVTLAPLLLRASLHGLATGLGLLLGLTGTVLFATGLGRLTQGGKFFTGLYVVAWYLAIQGEASLDFTGLFAPEPALVTSLVWLAAGLATVIPAAWRETLQARG